MGGPDYSRAYRARPENMVAGALPGRHLGMTVPLSGRQPLSIQPKSPVPSGLLERVAFHHDRRALDPMNGQVLGASVPLKRPSAVQAALLGVPATELNSAAFTTLFEVNALNTSSPETFNVVIDAPQIKFSTEGDPQNQAFDLKARVQWGTPGGLAQADIDIRNGTAFTVLGTFCRVSIIYTAFVAVVSLPIITVHGAISYGVAGSALPSTWTGFINGVAVAGTAIFAIPPFARDVVVYNRDQTTGLSGACIIEVGAAAVVNGPGMVISQAANVANPLRLPQNAPSLFVTNSAANASTIVPVFGLAL